MAKTTSDVKLASFEEGAIPSWIAFSSAKGSIVTGKSATDGRQALQIAFTPTGTDDSASITLQPTTPWNWSQMGDVNLAFDATNTGVDTIQIYVSVTDAKGVTNTRSAALGTGKSGTFYFVLNGDLANQETGMRDTPAAWKAKDIKLINSWGLSRLDVSQITNVKVWIKSAMTERDLQIDNVRVRTNPPIDPNYLTNIIDKYGQTAKVEFVGKIHNDAELKAATQTELAALAASKGMPDRSKFGGWTAGPRQRATGNFRTEKVDGKWWLVDPEGYLFFSDGVANVRMANTTTVTGYDFHSPDVHKIDPEEVTPEDSKDVFPVTPDAQGTRFLASDLRKNMFTWLPDYKDPMGAYFGYSRSFFRGPLEHGESYSFYLANLQRKYGDTIAKPALESWKDVTLDRMKDWGFTSFGNWIDPMFYDNQKVPYFANGWIIGDYKTVSSGSDLWGRMPDPFDPEFIRRAQVTVDAIAKEVNNSPWCVGVFVDNEKSWGRMTTDRTHFGIAINALSMNAAESPAKTDFVEALRSKYKTIETLNARWNTKIASWDSLKNGFVVGDINEGLSEDLSMWLQRYSEQYFEVVQAALKRSMPNYLYMGARMASWGMPIETIRAAAKYTDVVSYNNYTEGVSPNVWSFLKDIDMPSIIGEYHMGAMDSGLYNAGLVIAANQTDRAQMFKNYMHTVIDNPYFVGAHWFEYLDEPASGRAYDGENYNVGFVSVADVPYAPMVKAAKEVNTDLYSRRYAVKITK
ncbi:MAG: beta-galactosidase [Asticcacaulis sp.]